MFKKQTSGEFLEVGNDLSDDPSSKEFNARGANNKQKRILCFIWKMKGVAAIQTAALYTGAHKQSGQEESGKRFGASFQNGSASPRKKSAARRRCHRGSALCNKML